MAGEMPDWVTLIFKARHTCSGRSGYKDFNVYINEDTGEMKPAWEVVPVIHKEYGSKCSGAVSKYTEPKYVMEAAKKGWTVVKNVDYKWDAGRSYIDVTYYYIPTNEILDSEREYDMEKREYYDLVKLPDGKVLKVYRNRVEIISNEDLNPS